jgi:hypothetical protein
MDDAPMSFSSLTGAGSPCAPLSHEDAPVDQSL